MSVIDSNHLKKAYNDAQNNLFTSIESKTLNLLLIGCGPHAKRIYLPAIKALSSKFDINLKLIVELEGRENETISATKPLFNTTSFLFTQPFADPYRPPASFRARLDEAAKKYDIQAVIIATEPRAHMQYALWAIERGLHVLMDKPISTHDNVATSLTQAARLVQDYGMLAVKRDPSKAFIINAQRRYHPGFQLVLQEVEEIAAKFGIPITSMQSLHCDGQWRLPKEIITQDYHPYNVGYGKVSHSGYHLIDIVSLLAERSFACSGKTFDDIGVFSSFIKPTGLLRQQNRDDYLRVFGKQYETVNEFSDEELASRFQSYGEVDSSSVITLFDQREPVANLTLNLLHNGFARRNWILPGSDLYKGNGRVKHEYHNIEQGPYQNIQIHSYQSNDKHNVSTYRDYETGGNNHFDIHIFRNVGVLGGEPLRIIRSSDLAAQMQHDTSKLVVEQVKHRVVEEFLEVITGQRNALDTRSDLSTHALSANLMSLIYQSGIKRQEVTMHHE